MYAIVRENTYDPAKLDQGQARLTEFQALHTRQLGYRGTMVVDVGDGRWLTVNLWETKGHAMDALAALIPEVQRLLEPMMVGPSELIGTGPVVLTDLTTS